jgi:transposase
MSATRRREGGVSPKGRLRRQPVVPVGAQQQPAGTVLASEHAHPRFRKIKHTIPERKDQIARRQAKGSAGGRPPVFDAAIYGLRHTVERGLNRLKHGGVATRYDKYALTYLGGVILACAVIHARVGANPLGAIDHARSCQCRRG